SCGFSNGGMMSYTLACELSDRFAAVASVAGTMNPALLAVCNPERQVPIMHVHGTLDAVVPINGSAIGELTDFGELLSVASTVEFWNGISSCSSATTFELPNTSILDFSSVSKTVYSDCETGLENWYYEIFAGGHTWPGAFPLVVVGNTNLDINASEEIWDFFSMYTLPEPSVGIEETLEENAKELIACYSLQGKEVEWGVDLPSGIYVLRFSDGSCEKRLLN
ncbi:MAG: alpha/beta hydrolase family esterase, partial [Flavobacteriales bacterium]